MEEVWREITDTNGLYSVSNLGRVKGPRKIIKPYDNGRGYLQVKLCVNGLQKNVRVHQLVAKYFVGNPQNYIEINHKDEDKYNNRADNLEWCSRSYNVRYSNIYERARLLGLSKRKPVTIQGVHYVSMTDAIKRLGVSYNKLHKLLEE